MKSMLRELYYGEIRPFERTLPKDPEYRVESKKFSEEMSKLKEELSEDIYKRIVDLIELGTLTFSMEAEQSFYNGFELGSMLMIEMYRNRRLIRE